MPSTHAITQPLAEPGIPFPARTILGVPVRIAGRDEAVAWLLQRLEHGPQTLLCFANTNLLNILRREKNAALLSGFLVLNDGIGIDIASRMLYGEAFPENLNGTDFTPALLERAGPQARVFLFGARAQVVQRAAEVFAGRHGVRVVGVQDGYSWSAAPDELIDRINQSGANILLVALGNPAQERWMRDNAHRLRANLIVGVGALFDFTAGVVSRAPRAVQALRLEWVYRLAQEPRRLGRRYSIDLLAFLGAVLAQRSLGR
ncbi:MAG: WecB/TagA/CpsF family glycosyltransferase [Alsobacter sp.]